MATNKNITMKQFNGADYDTLFPATIMEQLSGVLPLEKGGTGVDSLSNLVQLLSNQGIAQIETGHYVGTGVYGSTHPNSLTFDFVPKFLCIFKATKDYRNYWIFESISNYSTILDYSALIDLAPKQADPTFRVMGTNNTLGSNIYSLSNGNKTLTWYANVTTNQAESQLNASTNNAIYYYLAIG